MLSPQARISQEQLAALARLDTCSIANAIETFEVRLRNAGLPIRASAACLQRFRRWWGMP